MTIFKARTFSANFLEAGVAKYDNEITLIKQENLMNIASTFKGVPVVIDHIDPSEGGEIVGYVSRVYRKDDPDDNWVWCDFLVDKAEAINLIDNHEYSVSCSFQSKGYKSGGIYHGIPYDREIVDAEGRHMALVLKPKYDAVIINNSQDMPLFKKYKNEESQDKVDNSPSILVEVAGQTIPLQEALAKLEALMGGTSEEVSEKEEVMDSEEDKETTEQPKEEEVMQAQEDEGEAVEEQKIKIGEEELTIAELVEFYKANKEVKDNECDEGKEKPMNYNNSNKSLSGFTSIKEAKMKKPVATYDREPTYFSQISAYKTGKSLYGSSV